MDQRSRAFALASGLCRAAISVLVALALLPAWVAPAGAGEIRFLTWADYLAPEVIAAFEKESGTRVVIVPIHSSNDLLRGLTGGPGHYDVSTPLDYQMSLLIRSGAVEKIEGPSLANFANVEQGWRGLPYDRTNDYSVPFMWGTTSFVVDTDVYKGDIDTYSVLFNPPAELKGRVSLLVGTAEALRMGLIHLGLPPCSKDPAEIRRALDLFRPLINPELVSTISTVIPILSGDRAAIGQAWNGDALRARLKKPSLRYAYPREGTFIWSDTLVVPKGAPNREAAIAFVNFMLRPENAAKQSNFTRYANAVSGSDAFLDPVLLEAPEVIVPSSVKLNFREFCDNSVVASYVDAWDALLGYRKP